MQTVAVTIFDVIDRVPEIKDRSHASSTLELK